MQKMMKVGGGNSDQAAAAAVAAAGRRSNNNEGRSCCSSNGVRVCSDCNTTTTPLWRSGPQGPKVIPLLYLTNYFNFTVPKPQKN